MKRYDAMRTPGPERWLALDEQERIALVAAYHRRTRVKLPNLQLHAAFHVVVENQLAEGTSGVHEALERLMGAGLDRHDAIHAIGSVVTRCLWEAMNRRRRPADVAGDYLRRLKRLTAKAWLKGAG
ncbi:MAG: DUF1841 family protein [Candidatus Rokubacteria bacterium]|nr:DUF1841 family protein [Candidatus Rokubacteria bacterium]